MIRVDVGKIGREKEMSKNLEHNCKKNSEDNMSSDESDWSAFEKTTTESNEVPHGRKLLSFAIDLVWQQIYFKLHAGVDQS